MLDQSSRPRLYETIRRGFNTEKQSATTLWAVRAGDGSLTLETHDGNHPQPGAQFAALFLTLLAEQATQRYGEDAMSVFDAADGCEVDYFKRGTDTYHLRVRRFGALSNKALRKNRFGLIDKPAPKRRGGGRHMVTLQGHHVMLIGSSGMAVFKPHLRFG
jgi:hypothetical protein